MPPIEAVGDPVSVRGEWQARNLLCADDVRTMDRRSFLAGALAALLGVPAVSRAQRSGALPVIGYLNNSNPTIGSLNTQAFLRGLADLGWSEGRTIAVEYRW